MPVRGRISAGERLSESIAGPAFTDPALRHPRVRRRTMLLLGVSIFSMSLGIGMHMAMNINYLHELLAASSWQQGYLESIRETCGILSFFMITLLAGRSEPRLSAVMLIIMGTGLGAYYHLETISQVILFSLIWSFGFHTWIPVASSMQLALAHKGREGKMLGGFGSVGALGVLAALGAVYVLKRYTDFGMRELFLIAGVASASAAVPMLFMPEMRTRSEATLPFNRIVSRGYRLYCMIEFLGGMRRQIFLLFAVLVLVREHGIRVEIIAGLMFINQVLCLVLAPLAGHLVDRVGERIVLTVYFTAVGVLFLLYAAATSMSALFVIFVVDNALFVLRVAVPTFANRIARQGERTQLLALGVTMNHVGAVMLPLVGGALYATLGYKFPFYCGALVAVITVAVVQWIPRRTVSPARV